MASVKVVLAEHKILNNGEHPLWLRIIKDRKIRYKALGFSCRKEWWDDKANKPNKKHPNRLELETLLNNKVNETNKLLLDANAEGKDLTAGEIIDKTKKHCKKITVFDYFDIIVDRMKKANRIGNAQAFKDAKSAFSRFRNGKDMYFSELNVNVLNRMEEYLLGKNVTEMSISAYMRSLRSVYNRAIEEEYVSKECYPFGKYKISKLSTKTKKRAISKEQIRSIIDVELKKESRLWHSRNYFVFSYYNMGMNLIDIGYVTKAGIENGRIKYCRQKTGKEYNIKMLQPAIEILNYYLANQESEYIFPILNSKKHITAQQRKNRIVKVNKQVNEDLKEIAILCKIDIKLTTYVARHSWATVLKKSGVSTSIISEAMKHDTERTTQIYLESFENDVLDDANEQLLK